MSVFENIPSRIRFFYGICLVYGFGFVFAPKETSDAFIHFSFSLLKMLPILGLVFLVMFLGYVFLKPSMIHRYLGEDSGTKGFFIASFASIFFSGPTHILFPFLKELKADGMKNSLIAVFLNNRNVQPAFIPVMIYYFGWPFTLIFSFLVLGYALLSGLLIGYFVKD
jgi:uncharacterized membrane protein YraQ (UPF0718 family)